VLGHLHRVVADDRIGEAQVALDLFDQPGGPQVREEKVDPLELLLDLVGELALAPVVDLEQRSLARLDDVADLGVDQRDDVVGAVGAQDVDRFVLAFAAGDVARRAESFLLHVISSWACVPRRRGQGARRPRDHHAPSPFFGLFLSFGGLTLYRFMAAVKPRVTISFAAAAAAEMMPGSSGCSARLKSAST